MIVSAEVLINSLINGTQKGPSQEFKPDQLIFFSLMLIHVILLKPNQVCLPPSKKNM